MYGDAYREAYEALAPQLAALEGASVPRYTLDATHAVAQARGIALRLEPFRPSLARLLDFDLGHLDRFVDLANALTHVHTRLRVHRETVDVVALTAEAREARELLMVYVDLLVLNGTVAPEIVRRLRRGAGRLDLVEDLTVLSLVFADHPDTLGPGAPVKAAQVTRAYALGATLGQAVVRDPRDPDREHLLRERAKIGHLLVVSHGQLRRAMDYLRYKEGDADRLVPSLYLPRGKGKRRKAAAGDP